MLAFLKIGSVRINPLDFVPDLNERGSGKGH